MDLLHTHGMQQLVDVRRYPGSRRHPHFSRESLQRTLVAAGMLYEHMPALGGRRSSSGADSPNGAWRSASFRAYADYMASAEFVHALDDVIARADEQQTVLMCAEAVPWRCHRQLIADALVARGITVRHIITAARAEEHALNPLARVAPDGLVTYPAAPVQPELFES
jgi:uncharacterized protein (DUF488 family)